MLYSLPSFAKEIGYSKRTIFKLIKAGKITPALKRNGRNFFTEDQIKEVIGIASEEVNNEKRIVVGYIRVSSNFQKEDLVSQQKLLEQFSISNGFIIDEYIEDIGSGINFSRKGLLKLIDMVIKSKVSHVIISYQDRMARIAFDLIKNLFEKFGCEIISINIKSSSPEEELTEDLMTIINIFSPRLHSLRKNKKQIKELIENDSLS